VALAASTLLLLLAHGVIVQLQEAGGLSKLRFKSGRIVGRVRHVLLEARVLIWVCWREAIVLFDAFPEHALWLTIVVRGECEDGHRPGHDFDTKEVGA